jgi:MFS family permease
MNRNFWILTVGETLSILGSNFGQMAQAVLVYNLTGSKLAMGTILLLSMGVETLVRLLGAPLIDRFNRIGLMRVLMLVMTLTYAAPPVLAYIGLLQVAHLYLFAVATGLTSALYAPAYFALVPSIVKGEALVRANSVSQSLTSIAGLVGPAVAGLLIAALGPVPALTIDAISYGVATFSLFLLPAVIGRGEKRPATVSEGYLEQLASGIRFYGSAPVLILALAGAALMNFSLSAGSAMLVPFVRERLGMDVAAVGALSSALSGGMLLGGVVIGWIGQVKNRILAMLEAVEPSGAQKVLQGDDGDLMGAEVCALLGLDPHPAHGEARVVVEELMHLLQRPLAAEEGGLGLVDQLPADGD